MGNQEKYFFELQQIDFGTGKDVQFLWPSLEEIGGQMNLPNTTVHAISPINNRHLRFSGVDKEHLFRFRLFNNGTDFSQGTMDESGIADTRFALGSPVEERIVDVDKANDEFFISGDHIGKIEGGDTIEVVGSTGNDGNWSVSSTSYNSSTDETKISVSGDIVDGTVDGVVFESVDSVDTTNDVIRIEGDATDRVSSGDTISFRGRVNTNTDEGTHTVDSVSYDSGNNETDITVKSDLTDSEASGWVQNGIVTIEEQIAYMESYVINHNLSPQWKLFGGRFDGDRGDGTPVTTARFSETIRSENPEFVEGVLRVEVGKVV